MPAGYAHYIFGQKVFNSLDKNHQEIINRNIDLYNIGVHGPDILFYYKALVSNEIKDLGSLLHQKEAYGFFLHAKKIIDENQHDEAAIAYIYGFITHFVLDHSCHPYIGQMEKELNMTHSEIESELDRKLLVMKHLDPLTTSLTSHIHLNHEVSRIIAPFFDLEEKDIYRSLKDLLFYLGWIKAPGKLKRNFVFLCMKIGGIYDDHRGLLINYEENKTSQQCTLELIKKMDKNVVVAKKLIEEFMDNDLNDIYHHHFE